MTNPFRLSGSHNWEGPVAAICLLLGIMVSLAWIGKNEGEARFSRLDPDLQRRYLAGAISIGELQQHTREIAKLREENSKLENAIAGNSTQSKVLNESLQQVKLWAGLTPVSGPGITITLKDSENLELTENERIIHDSDLLRVVNEMWASDAEAIEVNGIRLVATSSIRCVGPVIHIDGKPVVSPVKVRVIGDFEILDRAMRLPGGVYEMIHDVDTAMIQIDKVTMHKFNAYGGNTELVFARLPAETAKKR